MKKSTIFAFLWILSSTSFCQSISLSVCCNKTTTLIFPFTVTHVDRGTNDVGVMQVREADNILLVKAASKNFASTNISIVTADGSVYCFNVNYNAEPAQFVYHIAPHRREGISVYAREVLNNRPFLHGVSRHCWGVKLQLAGIYIKDDIIYCQLRLTNGSPLSYYIGYLRFYIKDKQKSKKTALQVKEIIPLYVAGNSRVIRGMSASCLAVAIPGFTLPDSRYLAIDLHEKEGGRNLLLKVGNNQLLHAIPLSDLQ